jgi:DNA-binding transcriptional LysR family regulator
MDRLLAMRVFEKVVAEGGFAAAARSLELSPPVVTRLVSELEDHLGARLLHRTTRRLSLTDAGQAYLARVRPILQDVQEAEAVASAHTEALAGKLRLHAPPVLATNLIAPLIAPFRQLHPEVQLELEVESVTEPPYEEFDLTFVAVAQDFDAAVVARKVIESEAILVAAPSYVRRRGQPRSPGQLPQHDGLKLRNAALRSRVWRLWCPSAPQEALEIEVQPVLLANHTDTLLRAALDGAGIASMPLDLAAPHLASGALVRVLSPWITGHGTVYAVLPSRRFIPQRTRVFLDFVVERTQSLAATAIDACCAQEELAA